METLQVDPLGDPPRRSSRETIQGEPLGRPSKGLHRGSPWRLILTLSGSLAEVAT